MHLGSGQRKILEDRRTSFSVDINVTTGLFDHTKLGKSRIDTASATGDFNGDGQLDLVVSSGAPAKADGTSCSDGSACTQTDTCQAGTCTGSNPVTCTAADQCHDAGVCNPATGACSSPAKADGTSCSDGIIGTYVEATSTAAADSGNTFRYSGGQYIFNLGTKSLSAGTWEIGVDLTDGVGVRNAALISSPVTFGIAGGGRACAEATEGHGLILLVAGSWPAGSTVLLEGALYWVWKPVRAVRV